ncbi:DUF3558 family protein [Microbacterium sp. T2.11-28]|uniref:DUF3558 family protein n=1 Tax=Microbacterium sp. T2.11-28 TaxID=3041169 RepID=UPI0024778132|nr:DUF3558 family protein [Microbacterium sp. T2.11-28]CAI9390556.1 hypothetical protein MICABA_01498 [Microbacterium sp. T2.11-28]
MLPHTAASRPATRRRARAGAIAAAAAAASILLTACTGSPAPTPPPSAAPTPSASATPTPTGPVLADFPFGPSTSTTPLPDDCRAILTDSVLAELEGVPLNAPGMGGGIRPDSSRVCAWGEPGAAGTWLVTVIGFAPYREATDALFALGNEGYTCYEPDEGVRCERTWEHETLPVTQGRTLYYRDGIIVDTQYSNLAPTGYTNAIIAAMWPSDGIRPTPTP